MAPAMTRASAAAAMDIHGAAGDIGDMPIVISTTAELDDHIALVDAATGPERHARMGGFSFVLPPDQLLDIDPFTDHYREIIRRQYLFMTGDAAYNVAREADVGDFAADDPYPFSGRHPGVVGDHFGAIAFLMKYFPVMPPGRVLDVGAGWGNTSLMLARTGYRVDALDINKPYLDLIDAWAARLLVSDRVRTLHRPFDQIGALTDRYDTIMFFESFHHALDHSALLDACKSRLGEGGALLFAGEPIYADWPAPWSLRSDSLAAYCIRKYGWMELGFNETYFIELCTGARL